MLGKVVAVGYMEKDWQKVTAFTAYFDQKTRLTRKILPSEALLTLEAMRKVRHLDFGLGLTAYHTAQLINHRKGHTELGWKHELKAECYPPL